jgi:hypothetical protein
MARILTSLHGKLVGLDSQGRLIAPKGVVTGEHGSQFAMPSPSAVVLTEDFLGDVVPDQINLVKGTDTSPTDAAVLTGGLGGIMRLVSGDSAGTIAADMVTVNSYLNWQATNGDLVFQTRFKLNTAIATRYAFLGFTDKLTIEAPVMSASSADAFTTNATNAFGFMYDTRMATKNWWATCKATGSANVNTLLAPVADTYQTFRVAVSAAGVAAFYINGNQVGTCSSAVGLTTPLTPVLCLGTFTAASVTADVDYIHTSMLRV